MGNGKSLIRISIKGGNRDVTKQKLSSSTLTLDRLKDEYSVKQRGSYCNSEQATNDISSLNSRQRAITFFLMHPRERERGSTYRQRFDIFQNQFKTSQVLLHSRKSFGRSLQ